MYVPFHERRTEQTAPNTLFSFAPVYKRVQPDKIATALLTQKPTTTTKKSTMQSNRIEVRLGSGLNTTVQKRILSQLWRELGSFP